MKWLITAIAMLASTASAETYAPYPAETWVFKVEFRRFRDIPQCAEEKGRGHLTKQTGGGRATYVLTGFPQARRLVCKLSNGQSFIVDAWHLFDIPEDGWKGPVEMMKRGDIREITARATYKKKAHMVDGYIDFETYKGRYRENAFWSEIHYALEPCPRKVGRWE